MKLKLTIVVRRRMTWSEVRGILIRFTNELSGTFSSSPGEPLPVVEPFVDFDGFDVKDKKGERVGSFRIVLDEDED